MPPAFPGPAARVTPPVISPVSALNVVSAAISMVPRTPSAALAAMPFEGTGATQCGSPSSEQPSPHVTVGPVQVVSVAPLHAGVHAVSVTDAFTSLPSVGIASAVPYAARLPPLRAHT